MAAVIAASGKSRGGGPPPNASAILQCELSSVGHAVAHQYKNVAASTESYSLRLHRSLTTTER